jgi:hypothetical protein
MKKSMFLMLLGWLTGEYFRLGIIAVQSGTTTVFSEPSGPHDLQIALSSAITGTGNQDVGVLLGAAGAGMIIKYQTAIIPFAVPATTAAQNTSSVSTTLQTGYQFATSSVYAINKPTQQASLGIGGVNCLTSAVLNVNYLNISSAAITPTGEANDVIEVRGQLTTSAALTPANVPINTTTEQIFTIVPGAGQPTICLPGTLAIVNKPTNQAGLAYSQFARVVGVNQVAVQFGVATTGAVTTGVTPTAAEAYNFAFLPQLNAYSPTLIYGIGAGQASATASTTLEQTSAVTGVLVSDAIAGITRATTQVGTGITSVRVTSASVIGLTYMQPGAAVTPTSSEVYLATIMRQAPLNPLMIYNQAVNATTCAANTSVEATTTVAGLVVSSSVLVNKPSLTPGIMIVNARVSAANTLAIQYANLTSTAIVVPSEVYTIGNIQLQGPGLGYTTTAGLFVAQSFYPSLQQSVTLANALQAALNAIDTTASRGASTTS